MKLKKFLITDTKSKPKELTFIEAIKIIESNNSPSFYIYENGSVEKHLIVE